MTPGSEVVTDRITTLLTAFGLTTAAHEWVPRFTQAHQEAAWPVTVDVLELEAEARRHRRIARLRQAARLPPGKTFETLDLGRLPVPLVQQLQQLATGAFLETPTNVLAFGLPGVGKSHALCALAHALVEASSCAVHPGLRPRARAARGETRVRAAARPAQARFRGSAPN
jgi:DNA replication protein DnaC